MDYLQLYNAANFDSTENLVAFLTKLQNLGRDEQTTGGNSTTAPAQPAASGLDQLLVATAAENRAHNPTKKPRSKSHTSSTSATSTTTSTVTLSSLPRIQQTAPLPSDSTSVLSSIRGVLVSSLPAPNQNAMTHRCKCKRSHCLKFYCACFESNQTCVAGECSCVECWNTLKPEHIMSRADALMTALEKNPDCFSGKKAVVFKGCHCKKSGCLKKYCDCYVAKLKCGELCRCDNCENREGSTVTSTYKTARRTSSSMSAAAPAQPPVQQEAKRMRMEETAAPPDDSLSLLAAASTVSKNV